MNSKLLLLAIFGVALTQARDWSKVYSKTLQIPTKPFKGVHPRITGGVESVPHSHPYQVGLITETPLGSAFCGGSLIAPNVVLTAAHCLDDASGDTEVILGAHRILENEDTQVTLIASKRIQHEKWDNVAISDDIALVILPERVELNDNIQLIKLTEDNGDLYEGDDALISGWGKDTDSATSISPVLREVTLPVISNSECADTFADYIRDTNICTDAPNGKSTCNGDSGGPLVVDGAQVGIVSFGSAWGCELGLPDAFTRVSSYLDWIEQNKP